MEGSVLQRVDNITKSKEDKREYRGLELTNRMKVLLISDPTTDKSAAVLNVDVGCLSDPDNMPGLAHFCEHMLFLGTEKYPNENDYTKFLNEHGGSHNAYTLSDHTIYFFDIIPVHLRDALERLAQFFIAPLFTESATERELNAVNSEHEKNISDDDWRLDQLKKHMSSRDHPFCKFGTGNRNTLETNPKENGISVRTELLKFHDDWYSSNIMSLVVLGKETLDELEDIVIQLFSEVKDKNVDTPKWNVHPFKYEQFRTITYVVPIKDIRTLEVVFPAPDLQEHYKSAPGRYLSNLVGHEGTGSLLSALKSRGWCDTLNAGYSTEARGFAFFGISIEITEDGMIHIMDILKLIFQYLNMLRKEGPLEWFQNELKDISSMLFKFKDKEDPMGYVNEHAFSLRDYPFEDVLYAPFIVSEWKPEIINNLLDDLIPDNIRVFVTAKVFENEVDQNEPWYKTAYKVTSIPESELDEWKNCGYCDELRMPDTNNFIPSSFDLYAIDEKITEYPVIIQDTDLSRIWYKQDDKFLLPKADVTFNFVSPVAFMDPINCNLNHMFGQLISDSLKEHLYAADLTGLSWCLTNTNHGLFLSIGGYDNKQHVLLDMIIDKLTNLKIDPKRFEIFKEMHIRNLKNFEADQPYELASYYTNIVMNELSWTNYELLAATKDITIERLDAFIPQILSKLHIECLAYGNLTEQKALELMEIVENRIKLAASLIPLLPQHLSLDRELQLENGCNYLYAVKQKIHKSSSVYLHYQCGLQNLKHNVLLELFAQITTEQCYDTLRTKEQLGYVVFDGVRNSNGVHGLYIVVQSDKHPSFVDERIEEYLRNILCYIEKMNNKEFEKHKDALAACRLEKPKYISAQATMYWSEICDQQYHFDRAETEVAYLRTVTKEAIIEFYQDMFRDNSEKRRKLAVHVLSMAEGGAGTIIAETENNNTTSTEIIDDLMSFKRTHGTYPQVAPYRNIPQKGKICKAP